MTALALVLVLTGCAGQDQASTSPATSATRPPAAAGGPSDPSAAPTAPAARTSSTTTQPDPAAPTATAGPPETITLQMPAGARLPALTWTSTGDPSLIAATFTAATWQMDTATDTGPAQAQQRSAQLATASYGADLRQTPETSGGAAWAELAAHQGWTTVSAHAEAAPDAPDNPTNSFRLVTATITAHGQDGWTSTALFPPIAVYVALNSDGSGGWRVNGATTSPA